jgi:3,4-dihydroxy 2-butanone 4-phosphate synthase/GTP cyclohydrolase II
MTERDPIIVSVPEAIEEYRQGRFVIITDDEDRENEGDLVIAAQFITPDAINFMAKFGRGLICCPLTYERVDELQLPMMSEENSSHFGTPFTVSVEAKSGVTTGISAGDRARTVQVLIDPNSKPTDLVRPGHMFPLRARDGGVLVRAGQTEASVDLARMAGLYPAAVLCEIMKADGEMARMPDLKRFARRHGLRS